MDTDPSTDDATNLTNFSSANDFQPTFSPNGTKIAFVSFRNGNSNIYKMNVDGSSQKRLTKNPAEDLNPTFSPSGRKIAFTSERDGNQNIYNMNAKDGTKQKRLTESAAIDTLPAYSPDGTKIAFQSSRVGRSEIFVMKSDGSNETPITHNPSPSLTQDRDPDWGVATQ